MSIKRSEWNCYNVVSNVAIVGGTHGNERHGVSFINELMMHDPMKLFIQSEFKSLRILPFYGNIRAINAIGTGAGVRYIDEDLNRCFLSKDLYCNDSMNHRSYEMIRAREIDDLLGPKNSMNPKMDYIIDLHSTTSNTGVLLCMHPLDIFSHRIAISLKLKFPQISVGLWGETESALLPSISKSGMTLEVGSIAHSTCNSLLYSLTKEVVFEVLKLIEQHNFNPGTHFNYKSMVGNLTMYKKYCAVGYPRDNEGNIIAFIHPLLQGQAELDSFDSEGGKLTNRITRYTSIFQTLYNNQSITLEEFKNYTIRVDCASEVKDFENMDKEELYPMFINEAAYYEKDIALVLMRRIEMKTEYIIN